VHSLAKVNTQVLTVTGSLPPDRGRGHRGGHHRHRTHGAQPVTAADVWLLALEHDRSATILDAQPDRLQDVPKVFHRIASRVD
jgi:hypothetical protein